MPLQVTKGELITLSIGPKDNHSCDLTQVELTISETGENPRTWILSKDTSDDLLAGNPHADQQGHDDVWSFFQEKDDPDLMAATPVIPAKSLLDAWRSEADPARRTALAEQVQQLVIAGPPADAKHPDHLLYDQLVAENGPLLGQFDLSDLSAQAATAGAAIAAAGQPALEFGLPRKRFSKHPSGGNADPANLIAQGGEVIEIRLPARLAAGREFVVTAELDAAAPPNTCVQAEVLVDKSPTPGSLVADGTIIAREGSESYRRCQQSMAKFREIFPVAMCYRQLVPIEEVVTLELFHRDDEAFARLMLDEQQSRRLDRLWEELRYVSLDALRVQEALEQIYQYATQDADPRKFARLRPEINKSADEFRAALLSSEPTHLQTLLDFAGKAYRRPLSDAEQAELRALYAELRTQDLDHDTALRLTLARVLLAPAFLYRAETPVPGAEPQPVNDWELASRLSYFLWSSQPDDALRLSAQTSKLHEPETLAAQSRRMLQDPKARALATEFACQWLEVRNFDEHNEKSEQVFPEFAALRSAMYEESVQFFIDLFQRDGSLLEVLKADHTFVNDKLAEHYGIPNVAGPEWRRVDHVQDYGRGGVLGMASVLSMQAGASRTSPILRGNWLLESLLGERLPKPPKNVPQLPDSELNAEGLTMRQITEKHRSVESCASATPRSIPLASPWRASTPSASGGPPIRVAMR